MVNQYSHMVEIPDNWVFRVNNKGEISRSGNHYQLNRIGWIANRDFVRSTWNQNTLTIIAFAEFEEKIESDLAAQEMRFMAERAKLFARVKMLDEYLTSIAPLVEPKLD
jgi:hypothetical protein